MKPCQILLLVFCLVLIGGCATRKADYTLGKSAVCELHGVPMSKTLVPIEYGLIRPDQKSLARYAASANSFPHAEDWIGGGCVVASNSARKVLIYTCPECKRLRAKWEADHEK